MLSVKPEKKGVISCRHLILVEKYGQKKVTHFFVYPKI